MNAIFGQLKTSWIRLSNTGRRLFLKEIIRVGEYIKGDVKYNVTTDVMDHWVTTFSQMKSNGVRVPIPVGHEDAKNPEKNRGWVDSIYRSGDSLYMIAEASDDEAEKIFARSDVSIGSPGELKDGKGNVYVRPIEHIALCTDPVVPGLGRFIPIAAARGKEKVMDWKKLAEALGITEEMTEANAAELITKRFATMVAELDDLKKKMEASKKDDEEDVEPVVTDEEEEDEKKKLAASRGKGKKGKRVIDPLMISLASENRKIKLEGLVKSGKITPAQRKKLEDQYIGADNKALVASLQSGTEQEFDRVIGLLGENESVPLHGRTGPQLMALNNPAAGSTNPLLADADRRAKEFAGNNRR